MQRLHAHILVFLFLTLLAGSCRKEEEFTTAAGVQLTFSDDSLSFDTVFTQFEEGTFRPLSVTKQLRVTNPNEQAVRVNISLKGNRFGVFKLNVDGQPVSGGLLPGKEISSWDSIIIFVQVYLDSTHDGQITDQLVFETNGNLQDVDLVTFGKKAILLRDSVLDCATDNLVWDATEPHVIYESILVPEGCTLTLMPGTHVYSHVKSTIYVAGTLIVNGTKEQPVIFEGDRLDPEYRDIPGQWVGIRLLTTSRDNVIRNAIIKNGVVGVEVDSLSMNGNPKLVIRETQISSMAGGGLVGYTADIYAENNLITDCGQFTFLGAYGGNYQLYHNTFVTLNYLTGFSRNNPTVLLDNSPLPANGPVFPLSCVSVNNIIWGSNKEEFFVNSAPGGIAPTLDMYNCLVRVKDFASQINNRGNILNEDPEFEDEGKGNYHVKSSSPARGKGLAVSIALDKDGKQRADPPVIGCYE
jgi:hypothetical protein